MKWLGLSIGIMVLGIFSWLGLTDTAIAASSLSQAPRDAAVYFISPQDGDRVTTSFPVKFGVTGMAIAPAGVDAENSGHHHLLIDLDGLPDLQTSLPATEQIKHFGGGQTETILTLPPGEHTLQLLLGNYLHIPHEPAVVSDPIHITVVADAETGDRS